MKLIYKIFAALMVGLMSLGVNAADLFDAGTATQFTTDVTDTGASYKAFVLGIIVILAGIGLSLTMTKKGLSKVGARF